MATAVKQDGSSFIWPNPPIPATVFAEEAFTKYSRSSPPMMEVLHKIPDNKLRCHYPKHPPVLEALPLRGKVARDLEGLETLKPGFNYPHYSQMTEGLMKYFHFLKMKYGVHGGRVESEEGAKQYKQWQLFQKQVMKEQEEYQIFAKQVAMASASDYAKFLPGAEEYMNKCLEANRKRVLKYPQLYRMNQSVNLKTDPALPSDPQLTLLQPPKYPRDVKLLHWPQRSDDSHEFICGVNNIPSSPEIHKETSSLSSEGSPEGVDIVISLEALVTLVDNHQLENYPHQWEIPFTVRTSTADNNKLQKTVIMEDPFMAHSYYPHTANQILACDLMKEHLINEASKMILHRKKTGTQDQTRYFRKNFCVNWNSSFSHEQNLPAHVSCQQDEEDPFGSGADDITALETLGSCSVFSEEVKKTTPSEHQAIQFVKSGQNLHEEKQALHGRLNKEPVRTSTGDDNDPFGSSADDINALETLGSFSSSVKGDRKQAMVKTPASKYEAIKFVKSGKNLQEEKQALHGRLNANSVSTSHDEQEKESLQLQQGPQNDNDVERGTTNLGEDCDNSETSTIKPQANVDQRNENTSTPEPEVNLGVDGKRKLESQEKVSECEVVPVDNSHGIKPEQQLKDMKAPEDVHKSQYKSNSENPEDTSKTCNKAELAQDPATASEVLSNTASEEMSNKASVDYPANCESSATRLETVDKTKEFGQSLPGQLKDEGSGISSKTFSEDHNPQDDETNPIIDSSALDGAMRSCLAKNDDSLSHVSMQRSDPSFEEEKSMQPSQLREVNLRVTRGMAKKNVTSTNKPDDSSELSSISPPKNSPKISSLGSIERRNTRSTAKNAGDKGTVARRTRSSSTSADKDLVTVKGNQSMRSTGGVALAESKKRTTASKKDPSQDLVSPMVEEDGIERKRTRSGVIIGDGNTTGIKKNIVHKDTGNAKVGSLTPKQKTVLVSLSPLSDKEILKRQTRSKTANISKEQEGEDGLLRKEDTNKIKPGGGRESQTKRKAAEDGPSSLSEMTAKRTRSGRIIENQPGKGTTPAKDDKVVKSSDSKGKPPDKKTLRITHSSSEEAQRMTRSGKVIGNVTLKGDKCQEQMQSEKDSGAELEKTAPATRRRKSVEGGEPLVSLEEKTIVVRRATRRRSARGGKVVGPKTPKVGATNKSQEDVDKMDTSTTAVKDPGTTIQGTDKLVGDNDSKNDEVMDTSPTGVIDLNATMLGTDKSANEVSDNGNSHAASNGCVEKEEDAIKRVPVNLMSAEPTVETSVGYSSSDNELHMDLGQSVGGQSVKATEKLITKDSDDSTRIAKGQQGTLASSQFKESEMEMTAVKMGSANDASKSGAKDEGSIENNIDLDKDGKEKNLEQSGNLSSSPAIGSNLGSGEGSNVGDIQDQKIGTRIAGKSSPQKNFLGDSSHSESELLIDLGDEGSDGGKGVMNTRTRDKSPPKLKKRKNSAELGNGSISNKDSSKEEAMNSPSMPLLDNILKLQKRLIASKKEVQKEEKSTPVSSGGVASQASSSVFDSIWQGQSELFKKPEGAIVANQMKVGQVKEDHEFCGEMVTEEKADTSLWKIGKLRMCLRGGIDGIYWDYKRKKVHAATVHAKVERQPWFGFEQVSMGEISRLWLKSALFPESSVLRGRIHCHSSEVMKLDVLNINNIGAWTQFQPAYAVKVLHNIFNKLLTLPDGPHLLIHHPRAPQAFIYSTVEEATAHRFIIYDLHAEHQKATLHKTPPPELPWAPLDPSMTLPQHDKWQIPCTFPASPYVKADEYYNTRRFNPFEGLREERPKKHKNKKKKKKNNPSEKDGAKTNQQKLQPKQETLKS